MSAKKPIRARGTVRSLHHDHSTLGGPIEIAPGGAGGVDGFGWVTFKRGADFEIVLFLRRANLARLIADMQAVQAKFEAKPEKPDGAA